MADKVQDDKQAKATDKPLAAQSAANEADDRRAFRRQAAIAIASAYITRHGGFGVPVIQEGSVRQIWAFADLLVSMENAGAEKPAAESAPQPAKRPVHPNDEWAVVFEDGKKRGGFMTEETAADFARGKAARVVQVAGPGVDSVRIAPSSLPAPV